MSNRAAFSSITRHCFYVLTANHVRYWKNSITVILDALFLERLRIVLYYYVTHLLSLTSNKPTILFVSSSTPCIMKPLKSSAPNASANFSILTKTLSFPFTEIGWNVHDQANKLWKLAIITIISIKMQYSYYHFFYWSLIGMELHRLASLRYACRKGMDPLNCKCFSLAC